MPGLFKIRIVWGYWMSYAPYPFHHPRYNWDGEVKAVDGRINMCGLIQFGGDYGDAAESLIPLDKPEWHWHEPDNRNRLGGILFEVKGSSQTVVRFLTGTIDIEFTIGELLARKVIRRHIGQRYSNVDVTVMFDGYYPGLDQPENVQTVEEIIGHPRKLVLAPDFRGPIYRWVCNDWAWAFPGGSVELDVSPEDLSGKRKSDDIFLQATFMCLAVSADKDETLEKVIERGGAHYLGRAGSVVLPYIVSLDGVEVQADERRFGHPYRTALVQEIRIKVPEKDLEGGRKVFKISNRSDKNYLLVGRVYLERIEEKDFEVTACPRWVLLDKEFAVTLTCRTRLPAPVIETPPGIELVGAPSGESLKGTQGDEALEKGEYRFRFVALEPIADAEIRFRSGSKRCSARIEQVAACAPEQYPMLVGMDDTTLRPIESDYRERIIRDIYEKQIADLYVGRVLGDRDRAISVARYCRDYGIFFQVADSCPFELASEIRKEVGSLFKGFYWSECDGYLWGYAAKPVYHKYSVPESERTMKTAYEDYVAYHGRMVKAVREVDKGLGPWVLLSSIGHSWACEAGMEITLSQFNKTHNVLLIADARGAARTYAKPFWGTYQAEGGHINPEGEQHLRMWWLSLYLAFVAGASQVNDEENLYHTWHQRFYGPSDRFTMLRRHILQKFNRYAKTHPRKGALKVKQACLIGRYACDVNDGLSRDDEYGVRSPMVWLNFGGTSEEWRPSTAEYGLRYLDVFFPDVWLQTLEQSPERVRRWYSGTPYGEIELIPVDASEEMLSHFKLLLLLGWNTMDEEQYRKLKRYVENGGTLFISVPHLTQNESRAFLRNGLEPLNLVMDGDFSELFGVKVKGRGVRFARIMGEEGIADNPVKDVSQRSAKLRYPSIGPLHAPVDLAEVELCGAEVLSREAPSGEPLLVRKKLGKGAAYLLCTHDFPGNSYLVPLVEPLLRALSLSINASVELDDPSGDVYYTVREEANGVIHVHLLNTDWSAAGNRKECRLRLRGEWIDVEVAEGRLSEIIWRGNVVLLIEDEKVYVESVTERDEGFEIEVHGYGEANLKMRLLDGSEIGSITFDEKEVKPAVVDSWAAVSHVFGKKSVTKLRVCAQKQYL